MSIENVDTLIIIGTQIVEYRNKRGIKGVQMKQSGTIRIHVATQTILELRHSSFKNI